jgi:hypothetical protein
MGKKTSVSTETPDIGGEADHTRKPAGGASAKIDLMRFELMRSAFYHDMCQTRLGRTHRLLTFVMVLLGSGAIAGFGAQCPIVGQVAGALVAVIGAASLVWGFGEAAVSHSDLRRRFYGLLADLEAGGDLNDLTARMTMIYADEPPINARINDAAHDRAGNLVYGPGNFRLAKDKT